MNPCLSVVIPVYNADKYLSACLNSLLSADGVDDTEIIMVDDGSSDDSGSIADDYAGRYDNIHAYHQENRGAGAARNYGINKASGKYIFFLDSDDRVDTGLFTKVIEKTKTVSDDVIMWDCGLYYETGNLLSRKDPGYFAHCGLDRTEKTYTGKQVVEILNTKGKGLIASVCFGAYKREFLVDKNLFLEEGIIYEDELWVPRVYLEAQSVLYMPEKVYFYRVHDDSVTNPDPEGLEKNVKTLMYVYPSLYRYYDSVLTGDPLREIVEGNLTKRYLHMIYKYRFWRYDCGKDIDKKKLWETSRKLRHKAMVLLLNLFV